ncbi:hypothetical protein WNY77_11225 [Paraglaciecola mesophila]|uniref:Uncharacterized protein n=1 Tax=Paraglaciecola mesophila TaxID=197222 RepID=A0ABU9SVV8_9ALTE
MKQITHQTDDFIQRSKVLVNISSTSLFAKVCLVSGVLAFLSSFSVFLGGIYEGAELVGFALDFSSFDVLSSAFLLWLLALSGYFAKHALWLLNLVPDYVLRHLAAKPKPLFIVPAVISLVPSAHGSRAPPIFS